LTKENDQKCLEEISNEPADDKKGEKEAPIYSLQNVAVELKPCSKAT